ncbi:MAG: hypothetical protein AAB217_11930 [Chloroflexota bacterium]
MIHNRSFTPNRSVLLLTASVALVVLVGAAFALGRITVSIPANPAVGADQPAPSVSHDARQAIDAYAARWDGLAQMYTNVQRAANADAARWTGLAEMYTNVKLPPGADPNVQRAANADAARWTGLAEAYAKSGDAQQAMDAYAARWAGLAQLYAEPTAGTISESQQANVSVAAHYTGLAIQEYARTGNREFLPTCISQDVLALLPSIGDDSWRSEVASCSQ